MSPSAWTSLEANEYMRTVDRATKTKVSSKGRGYKEITAKAVAKVRCKDCKRWKNWKNDSSEDHTKWVFVHMKGHPTVPWQLVAFEI